MSCPRYTSGATVNGVLRAQKNPDETTTTMGVADLTSLHCSNVRTKPQVTFALCKRTSEMMMIVQAGCLVYLSLTWLFCFCTQVLLHYTQT